jgi:NADPH:quinone reductase-like Zn-dependent oxidoreductase
MTAAMQAVVYEHFGDESVLSVREVPVPQPARGEVQVRVRMAGLNPIDFKLRGGMLRMLGKPTRPATTGKDFAGEITALGPEVQGFTVGQRVFGSVNPLGGQGTCAQFVAVSTTLIVPTPEGLSDEVAASLPVASGTALRALVDIAALQDGQAILVTGASGAVGASAVQIARSIGARITGVCGTANVEYVRSIGAAKVIDYKAENWRERGERFAVIFDAAAVPATFSSAKPCLNPDGIYINTNPGPKVILDEIVTKFAARQRCVAFMLRMDAVLLQRLAGLAAGHTIVPRIHEIVGLDQVGPAQLRMREGKVHGKVCVRIAA